MVDVMNAIAQVSAAPVTGPKLDNRRVLAGVVDLLIVAAGAALVLVAGDSLTGERQSALGAVILGWALYYFFALESGDGQTVGKKLMKLRVVRVDGSPVGMREVAVRTVLRVVDNYLVGLIVMLATGDRRQRIGDLAAGTIIVDASAPAAPAAPAAPVVEPAAEEADEPSAEATPAPPDPTKTITLPARPAKPATLEDLTEPPADEAVAQEEDVAEEPVAEEPVAEDVPVVGEPAFEVEPVEDEPVFNAERVVEDEPVEEDEPVVEDEPGVEADEDPVPEITSPSLESLAQDVEAAKVEDEPAEEQAQDDVPMTVRSVETVSAIDLVMGGASEEEDSDSASKPASDPEDPASA
jgi:uncharacterized RDD family membrane protein YckC